jgi:hypothetical protein
MRMDTNEQRALAAQVATALGWSTAPAPKWGDPETAPHQLAGPNGERLWINTLWNNSERVEISADWPTNEKGESTKPYGANVASITVALARGADAIAKSIKGRILPEYLTLLQKAQENAKSHNEYLAQKRAQAKRIQEACPLLEQGTDINRQPVDGSLTFRRIGLYGGFEVANGTAKIDITNLSIDLAVKIAALIYEAKKDAKPE